MKTGIDSRSEQSGVSYLITPFPTRGGYILWYIGHGYNVCLEGTHRPALRN